MLEWFRAVMPKEDRFLGFFERHAALVVPGVSAPENDADAVTREVLLKVRCSFITPFDQSATGAIIEVGAARRIPAVKICARLSAWPIESPMALMLCIGLATGWTGAPSLTTAPVSPGDGRGRPAFFCTNDRAT